MTETSSIGVFDSGIGGVTVATAIARELPEERILYFGDTARCPYGDRTPAEVLQFTTEILDFLYQQDVKMLVVACNTATAAALPHLGARYPVPVVGVIDPGARAAARVTTGKRIGVIGTAVTVASGAYERAIQRYVADAEVISLACPAFVPLVERGLWDGALVEQTVRDSLEPLLEQDVDTLILGCTHYPLLQPTIARVMGPRVHLISSAEETAREVRRVLEDRALLNRSGLAAVHQFYTSGDAERMRMALVDWAKFPIGSFEVHRIDLASPALT